MSYTRPTIEDTIAPDLLRKRINEMVIFLQHTNIPAAFHKGVQSWWRRSFQWAAAPLQSRPAPDMTELKRMRRFNYFANKIGLKIWQTLREPSMCRKIFITEPVEYIITLNVKPGDAS